MWTHPADFGVQGTPDWWFIALERREELEDVLRDAAAESPAALPLLEFTLDELYANRVDDYKLTFESFEHLAFDFQVFLLGKRWQTGAQSVDYCRIEGELVRCAQPILAPGGNVSRQAATPAE